jgi:hypothetical protein
MLRMHREDRLIAIVALALLTLFVWALVYDYKHPCIAWESGICGGTTMCTPSLLIEGAMDCTTTPEYECQLCTERAP